MIDSKTEIVIDIYRYKRNPLKKSNEVKTAEEEIELATHRISEETLIEKQRNDEFCRCAVEALGRNGGRGNFGLTKPLTNLRDRYFVKDADKEVEKYIDLRRVQILRTLEGRVAPERYWPSHCDSVAADIFWQSFKYSGHPPTPIFLIHFYIMHGGVSTRPSDRDINESER
ncbi:hypothetical protein EVAR_78008_1 [Eumeta japonica]|uniref:Uncharacterized protein n=1 Tax=Eumeta variegata TaxID=151549 RepID=A0A4C1T2M9_EUMVA|nr:hypothetical protein EVAR_78008_1 [Eumeta japonica]